MVTQSKYLATPQTLAPASNPLHRAGSRLVEMYRVWRERQELHSLEDRDLRDIGLNRLDIARETRRPFWDTRSTL